MKNSSNSFRLVQLATLAACLLALLFFAFFNASKHSPALARIDVFTEDPYDAVGSFGIQLALLAALLSFIRILRPYPGGVNLNSVLLILHGDALALLSILVTLAADAVAMLRFLPAWTGSPAGRLLGLFILALFSLTGIAGWLILHLARSFELLPGRRSWAKTIIVVLAGTILLALYPAAWRASIQGSIFTALLGMALFLVLTAALARLVFPSIAAPSQDFLDDLWALYQWLKEHASFAASIFLRLEKAVSYLLDMSWARAITSWLNPRKHSWNIVILLALAMGIFLIVAETTGEGLPQARLILLVFGVFIGIESAGVLLGYALFRRFLGIFRN
jgi:hypothetical protein